MHAEVDVVGVSRRALKVAVVALMLAAGEPWLSAQQDTQEGPLPVLNRAPSQADAAQTDSSTLTNDAVIRMTKAGVGDGIIAQAVRTQPGTYRTGPDDLIALKQAGVGEPVISAMLARSSGLAQRQLAGRPELRRIDVTPLSPEVDDPGVYWKNKQGQWEPVSPELVTYRSGGAAKSVLTRGVVRPDRNGKVAGPRSTLVLQPGTEMMILAPRPADPVEFVVLRFREKSDRREFRVESGSFFHTETGSERDQLDIPMRKLNSRLFAFTVPADLKKGEYGVLPPGSANTSGISFAGKMYTFAVKQ